MTQQHWQKAYVANLKSDHELAASAAAALDVTRNDVIHQVIRIINRRNCFYSAAPACAENIRRYSKTSRERQSVGKLFDPPSDLWNRGERLTHVRSKAFGSFTQVIL